jgi:hypothetical protein
MEKAVPEASVATSVVASRQAVPEASASAASAPVSGGNFF